MAEHDYVIANDTGANVRADINNALSAIVSNNSKATAPSTTFAYMFWADTGSGILKQRNAANDGWINILTLSTGAVSIAGGLAFGSDAQGDITYRGASAYERLAKGTAGQVLKMNSGATAPEWGTDSAVDLTADQSWTGSQRATLVTDNDGSFDMDAGQNFKCTPSGDFTLTFTNFADGQSGFIILINSGGHTVSLHANSKADANLATTVTTAGTYILNYISDGTNAYLTNSAVMA